MDSLPDQAPEVQTALAKLRAQSDLVTRAYFEMTKADGGNAYTMDFLVTGAAKRNASTAAAFSQLVESWNMVAARAMLRLQIDTALRLSAAWIVGPPNTFARRVIDGERIDKMKDQDNKRLADAHLVELHAPAYPWLPLVYERLSGYVHLSDAHIFAPMRVTGEHIYEATVGPCDLHFPTQSWLEVVGYFIEITGLLLLRMREWTEWKAQRGTAASPSTDQP